MPHCRNMRRGVFLMHWTAAQLFQVFFFNFTFNVFFEDEIPFHESRIEVLLRVEKYLPHSIRIQKFKSANYHICSWWIECFFLFCCENRFVIKIQNQKLDNNLSKKKSDISKWYLLIASQQTNIDNAFICNSICVPGEFHKTCCTIYFLLVFPLIK